MNSKEALSDLNKVTIVLEKYLGEDVFLPDEPKPMDRCPTGLEVVDHIFGGGMPWGHVIERILDDFWASMPDARAWVQQVHAKCREQGGVHTHFGRWRPLPWIHSRVPQEVAFGERSAVNTIVQGTAADIMKIGMVRLWKKLRDHNPWGAQPILTVHDSILVEFDEDADIDSLIECIDEQLCFPIDGYPELEIDVKVGQNWWSMKKWAGTKEPHAARPASVQEKTIAIPSSLPAEDLAQLIRIIDSAKSSIGEISLTLTRTDKAPIGPIAMSGSGYQKVLRYLVTKARNGKDQNGSNSPADTPRVAFA